MLNWPSCRIPSERPAVILNFLAKHERRTAQRSGLLFYNVLFTRYWFSLVLKRAVWNNTNSFNFGSSFIWIKKKSIYVKVENRKYAVNFCRAALFSISHPYARCLQTPIQTRHNGVIQN